MSNINNQTSEHGKQRSRSLTFAPVTDKFTEKACMVESIEVPEISRSQIVPVFVTKDKSAQYFHTQERNEFITFIVTYIPFDNSDGKGLLPAVKEIVDKTLTKDCTPDVATISTYRNGEIEKTININDAVVKSGTIILDKDDFINIVFEISGILAADY
jgi:hypothetical protein